MTEIVQKTVLYAGTKHVLFKPGTKVKFHYQTRKCDSERTLLDDSRNIGVGAPMELVLGKKFKLEIWEVIIQKMALNEVAQFTVDKTLVSQYPFISKTLRDVHLKKDERVSTCAMSLQKEGLGYNDLNELLKDPCNLEFTLELIEAQQPEEYEKENWQLTENERLEKIPELRNLGNAEYKNKNFQKAADYYAEAIGLLEQLQLKEKPHDTEWIEYSKQQIPFLLNFALCKLNEKDYYAVIEHCTTVLKTESDNVKALFRRGKAHVGAWNPKAAQEDFTKAMKLDPTLETTIKKELLLLEELIKKKDNDDKKLFKNIFS